MKDTEELVRNLYLTDEYLKKNPSLHEEESPWKVHKIVPLIDRFIDCINGKEEINILDVGGGAGFILNSVSTYIESSYGIRVNKYALDLSPHMLEIQSKTNPDMVKALNEDIRKTSFRDKEIDLILLIDVLEHVPNPAEALEELRRISSFSILKVPLQDSIFSIIWNFMRRGEPKRYDFETYGHINFYSFSKLKHQIEKHAGRLLNFCFTLRFNSRLNTEHYTEKLRIRNQLRDFFASFIFLLSPGLCSTLFGDIAFILVQCYDNADGQVLYQHN